MKDINFPVLAIVDNLNPMELIEVMRDWGRSKHHSASYF